MYYHAIVKTSFIENDEGEKVLNLPFKTYMQVIRALTLQLKQLVNLLKTVKR